MLNGWKEIWSKRSAAEEQLDLRALIDLDGFDRGAGRIETADWIVHAAAIGKKLGLWEGASVYEVGCGAGAFLRGLREHYRLNVGGLDYSASLIRCASRVMPDGQFDTRPAHELTAEPSYDFVVANGVFHYFELEYADEVLDKMIRKAGTAVAVLEVPDLATMQDAETERRCGLPQDEYDKLYSGLRHQYFARDWFRDRALSRGFRCEVLDTMMSNYAQARFRYGVIISKR